MKSTESLADITTRLLEIARSSPQTARVRQDALLASFLLASPPPKTLRGGRRRLHPLHHFPESDVVAKRDDAKNGHQTWRRHHGQASQRPFRLRDIAEAGPLGPNVLLLIPLKPRDGEHALSSFPSPLANILLASKPKEARPPRPGDDRERQRETLLDLGDARSKSRGVGEERESHDPYL